MFTLFFIQQIEQKKTKEEEEDRIRRVYIQYTLEYYLFIP